MKYPQTKKLVHAAVRRNPALYHNFPELCREVWGKAPQTTTAARATKVIVTQFVNEMTRANLRRNHNMRHPLFRDMQLIEDFSKNYIRHQQSELKMRPMIEIEKIEDLPTVGHIKRALRSFSFTLTGK